MSTSRAGYNTGSDIESALARDVSFKGSTMRVHLTDGRELVVEVSRFPRLHKASPEQREQWELIGPGVGLHWEEIDEDISVANLLKAPESLLIYT